MWIGGVMALISLMIGAIPETREMMYMAALSHLIIDKLFLIPGGIGITITAIIYGFFTNWGFIKHRWIAVKTLLTIILIMIGAGYMGVVLENNYEYSKLILTNNSDTSTFWENVHNVIIAGIVQLFGFALIIIISVIKPRKKTPTAP